MVDRNGFINDRPAFRFFIAGDADTRTYRGDYTRVPFDTSSPSPVWPVQLDAIVKRRGHEQKTRRKCGEERERDGGGREKRLKPGERMKNEGERLPVFTLSKPARWWEDSIAVASVCTGGADFLFN